MKKFILPLILITLLNITSVCQAQDVWVCGDNYSSTYVMTETYQRHSGTVEPYGFHVNVKKVSGQQFELLKYIFLTWKSNPFKDTTSIKSWYFSTQYMNREDPLLVDNDQSGQAAAILLYCLNNL